MAVPRFWRTITVTRAEAKQLQAELDKLGSGYADMFSNVYEDDVKGEWSVASGYYTQHQLNQIDTAMAALAVDDSVKLGRTKTHNGEAREKMREWKLRPKEQVM